jgi:hypothetical protein
VESKADRRQDYVSRRDEMKVAWQFIARDVSKKKTRPVGYGMIGFAIVLFKSTPVCELSPIDHTVPTARTAHRGTHPKQ